MAVSVENCKLILEREERQGSLLKLLSPRDKFGWSCLRWACRMGNLQLMKQLLFHGMDWVSDLDPDGKTLLHLICALGHNHILNYLLNLDSKQEEPFGVTRRKDSFGMTCLQVACFFGQSESVMMIANRVPELLSETLFYLFISFRWRPDFFSSTINNN